MRASWNPRSAAIAAVLAVAIAGAVSGAAPLAAQQVRFSTENDLLGGGDTPDDLYTFSVALEIEHGGFLWSLREDAFTDRAAGVRFDQTFLGARGRISGALPWSVQVEGGAVRAGHGLFGEDAQNALHRVIGDDEVELRYLDNSLHARVAADAERFFALGERLEVGPRLEAELTTGIDARALAGVAARWQPGPRLAFEAMVGARWAEASLAELEPHLHELAPAARVGAVLDERFFVSWSYNEHGDRRDHLSAGWRLPLGRGAGPAGPTG